MALPISDTTIKLVWENNPDTALTATNLSKQTDYIASYMNFEFDDTSTTDFHKEGEIILTAETTLGSNLWIRMKRGTLISLVNTVEDSSGTAILSENDNYRLFDLGLEDIYLRPIYDMDSSASNPTDGTWGINQEWFIYLCDKMDDSTTKTASDDYGGGAQILISQGRNYPVGYIPGHSTILYTEKGTRKIGGFKSDANGKIVATSVWDIAQRHTIVRANDYYIFSEYAKDSSDNYRFINRKLRLSDLDSASDSLTIKNNLYVCSSGGTTNALSVNTSTNTVTIPNLVVTGTTTTQSTSTVTTESITTLNAVTATITTGTITTGTITTANIGKLVLSSGIHTIANSGSTSGVFNGFQGTIGENDFWFIGGSQTGSNNGYMEIATGDDATEPIYVRQYTGTPHSSASTSGTITRQAVLLDASGNTTFPGSLTAAKVYNAVWNDLAEYFLSGENNVIYGKVYYIKNGLACLTSKRAMTSVYGVASDTPGFLLKTEYEKGGIPIALAGSVRVWVRGKVKSGSELVSDKDGYASSATLFERIFKRGAIIGKAIESNSISEDKRILMLVK